MKPTCACCVPTADAALCAATRRYYCNKPVPQVAALAAAHHPAANAFHLNDSGLYVVHNPALPLPPDSPVAAAAVAAAAAAREACSGGSGGGGGGGARGAGSSGGAGGGPQALQGVQRGSAPPGGAQRSDWRSPAAAAARAAAREAKLDAATAAGLHVVTRDSHGPPPGAAPAGRVECLSEGDIFRALGLAYVPPHMRSWS
jgi:hypothetical protein